MNDFINESELTILSWDELFKIHKTRNAINISDERIISVLAGNQYYDDKNNGNEFLYTIPNRQYYKKTINRFKIQKDNKKSFNLYQKIKSNTWASIGEFYVFKINEFTEKYELIFHKVKY